jgi:hypothetical protein
MLPPYFGKTNRQFALHNTPLQLPLIGMLDRGKIFKNLKTDFGDYQGATHWWWIVQLVLFLFQHNRE